MGETDPFTQFYLTGFTQWVQESLANAKVSVRQPCWPKTAFTIKYPLKVILGHSFYSQLLANKG